MKQRNQLVFFSSKMCFVFVISTGVFPPKNSTNIDPKIVVVFVFHGDLCMGSNPVKKKNIE